MPDGLPEFLLIVGALLAIGLVACMVVGWCLDDHACSGQVVENISDGSLHDADQWELQLLPGYTGPWPCPNERPCPIHDERTR